MCIILCDQKFIFCIYLLFSWHIRPFSEHNDWHGHAPKIGKIRGLSPPSISTLRNAASVKIDLKDREPRFRVVCRQGDLLFINTRLWWHSTCKQHFISTALLYLISLYLANLIYVISLPFLFFLNCAHIPKLYRKQTMLQIIYV